MKKFKGTDLIIGVIFTLLFISIGVIATVNFRLLYYLDIKFLNIAETSGYSNEIIIENYDALIDYNSPFYKGKLEFPSLPSSNEGIIHFEEVKQIFMSFYYIFAITFILALIIVIYKSRKKDTSYLLISSITVLVLPTLVLLGSAIDFDAAFVVFHKIFFRNDYWLFDPTTDPVITILPDTFFLHAMLVIVFFVLLGSLILFLCSNIGKKRKRR